MDFGSIVTYTLVTTNVPFSVNRNNGQLSLSGVIDYETTIEYTLEFEASDGQVPVRTALTNVSIRLTDVNDNAPVMSQAVYAVLLPENHTQGLPVITVSAQDADGTVANNVVSYALQDAAFDNVSFAIDPDTGVIRAIGGFDYETRTSFSFSATATDNGSPALTSSVATVTVRLENLNDNLPVFSPAVYQAK